MANTLLTPSTLFLGTSTYSGAAANGTVFNSANSKLTHANAWTDPDPADVGGIASTNTSTTYKGSASTIYQENHSNDQVYLELGEAIRVDMASDGSMSGDPWLRITKIERYANTVITLSNGTTVSGAVNIVTAVNPATGVSYQTMLFADTLVADINAATTSGTVNIVSITLGTYSGYGSGTADLTQVMLASNFDSEVFNPDIGFVCFAGGTRIETADGPVPVEDLVVGDRAMTRDHGLRPVRWIGSRRLSAAELAAKPHLRPIRIAAGALGPGRPCRDLLVSPQHRILLRAPVIGRMFNSPEVLVAAKHLVGIDGVSVAEDLDDLCYYHILFDRHEVVFANGAEAESLFTGQTAMQSLSPQAKAEIFALFPILCAPDFAPVPARPLIAGRKGRRITERLVKNGVPAQPNPWQGRFAPH